MNEIKCPKCGTLFQINEMDYVSITKQIRDQEFEREILARELQYKKERESAVHLAQSTIEKQFIKELNQKELEIQSLENKLKVQEEQTQNQLEKSYREQLHQQMLQITELQHEIQLKENQNQLVIQNTIIEKDKKIDELHNMLKLHESEFLLKERNLKESYEDKIKIKDDQIAYYKDFKAKQSTKMIGESLEQHCNNEFNKLRPLFKHAYFEKDNDIRTGSKGDFIYRDYDEEGTEVVSIMFEMKNEADTTVTKHKNEDFFKELDKDRREKKCEYAVLVTLLEIDNEYYNNGIVDVSYKYEKMYVIRPQFFIPLITLIRGMSFQTLQYKKELQIVQNQNIDIAHFEENMNSFKEGFGRNYRLASEKFKKAIEEIDKTIDHLQKTKEALVSSENNLRLANNKAEELTIKKLTRNSETMAKMFENLQNQEEEIVAV